MYSGVLVFLSFFNFVAKLGTTKNHRNGSSAMSYKRPFSRDLNIKKISQKFSQCREKNRFEIK